MLKMIRRIEKWKICKHEQWNTHFMKSNRTSYCFIEIRLFEIQLFLKKLETSMNRLFLKLDLIAFTKPWCENTAKYLQIFANLQLICLRFTISYQRSIHNSLWKCLNTCYRLRLCCVCCIRCSWLYW